jgi:photosystem II stability/assembly factor-like uncharacterized protein
MRSGGIWAVAGSYLLTSTDNGASWRAGNIPAEAGAGTVFVLDPDHVWAVSGYGSWCNGSCQLVFDRTSDGGRTWSQSSMSSEYPCDQATFSFVDADRGFLMCATYAQPASTGSYMPATPAIKGSATLLRTADGGASWSIVSHATGLGVDFTASDADTLWSAEDYSSSSFDGAALYVSRDAGATWSSVDLPELSTLPVGSGPVGATEGSQAGDCGGPTFLDASNGAFAVEVSPISDPWSPTVWFYRTSDAGRSWTLAKKAVHAGASVNDPLAMVGLEWAIIGTNTVTGLTTSGDSGASWTDVPGSGLPDDGKISPMFDWVDFTDRDHAAATVNSDQVVYGAPLMLSSDGGRTWHPANFGDARAKVGPDPALDPTTAQEAVDEFEKVARPDPQAPYAAGDLQHAWQLLSPYSQQSFGGVSAFESAEGALTTWTAADQVGQATQGPDALNRASLGAGVWDDLNSHADMSRAYVLQATSADASEPAQTFVAAPLATTGEWRVWVVTMP